MKLITATGREIETFRFIKGGLMDYLHIYINSISLPEMYEVFSNPEETGIITVIEVRKEQSITHVYKGYTELYSINKPFLDSPENTWVIWLQQPMEVIESFSSDDDQEIMRPSTGVNEVTSNAE